MKLRLFSRAVVVGRPRLSRAPMELRTSMREGPVWDFACLRAASSSSRSETQIELLYPHDWAMPTKSIAPAAVGMPPTVSCAALLMITWTRFWGPATQ